VLIAGPEPISCFATLFGYLDLAKLQFGELQFGELQFGELQFGELQ
jgi:hypothetical protein